MRALACLALAVALSGCAAKERAVQCVREARALLVDPHPGGPKWEARRTGFMLDSDEFKEEQAK